MKELLRRRVAVMLFFLIPSLFYTVVLLTTTERTVAFKLASVSEETVIEVSERNESLIFIGLASVGLLSSFVALIVIQQNTEVNRRLVLCGYRPSELVIARLGVLLVLITLVAIYVAALLLPFFQPRHVGFVMCGFALGGFVYGCYGLLVGAVFRRELEGILFIALLANIDVGWLQNPIYYADAQNKALIRHLPAFFPSQTSMVSAFTDYSLLFPVLGALTYGLVLLTLALVIYSLRMKLVNR
jgi:hypothetical protein